MADLRPPLKWMQMARHWIAHLLGWQMGHVYTWRDPDTQKVMVAFRCRVCGEISGGREA